MKAVGIDPFSSHRCFSSILSHSSLFGIVTTLAAMMHDCACNSTHHCVNRLSFGHSSPRLAQHSKRPRWWSAFTILNFICLILLYYIDSYYHFLTIFWLGILAARAVRDSVTINLEPHGPISILFLSSVENPMNVLDLRKAFDKSRLFIIVPKRNEGGIGYQDSFWL